MTNTTQPIKQSSGIMCSDLYLIAGYFKDGKPQGELDTIRNTVIVLETEIKKGVKQLKVYTTDDKGLVINIKLGKRSRSFASPLAHDKLIIPPSDIVNALASESATKWTDELVAYIQDKAINPITVGLGKIAKSDLRKPKCPPKKTVATPGASNMTPEHPDQSYSNWYHSLKDAAILDGILLHKTKAVFFTFSNDNAFKNASVQICLDTANYPADFFDAEKRVVERAVKKNSGKSNSTQGNNDSTILMTLFFDRENKISNGLHTIRVEFDPAVVASGLPETRWCGSLAGSSGKAAPYYEFKALFDFGIKTHVGEFDIIHCDPISVEESLLQQMPTSYSHILESAKSAAVSSLPEIEASFNAKFPGIGSYYANLKSGHAKVKWAVSFLTPENSNALINSFAEELHDSIEDRDSDAKAAIDAFFTIKDAAEKWLEIRKTVLTKIAKRIANGESFQEYKDFYKIVNLGLKRTPRTLTQINDFVIKYYGEKIDEVDHVTKRNFIAKWNQKFNEKLEEYNKKVGDYKKTFKEVSKVFGAVVSAVDLADSGVEIYEALENKSLNEHELSKLIENYSAQVEVKYTENGQPASKLLACRSGMMNLESKRQITVSNDLGIKGEVIAAVGKLVDTTMKVCALIPAAEPVVVAYEVLETAYELGKATVEVVHSVFDVIDRVFYDGMIQDLEEKKQFMNDCHNEAVANQMLLRSAKNKGNEIEVKMRLRAHAIYGLHGLLYRAALEVLTVPEYSKLAGKDRLAKYQELCVKKFKIPQFVQNYILNDNWIFSFKSITPLNMDTFWVYMNNLDPTKFAVGIEGFDWYGYDNHNRALMDMNEAAESEARKYSFFYPIQYNYQAQGLAKYKNETAGFQQYFPVHFLATQSMETFFLSLRGVQVELEKDCIQHTAIFSRPWNSEKESDWHIMDDLTISPLHQIRILIVLKDGLDFPYPISAQVCRGDMMLIKGPVYNSYARRLTESDFLKSDPDSQIFINKLKKGPVWGTVFYPFYQFFSRTVFGLKPMAGSIALLNGIDSMAHIYAFCNGLKDMFYQVECVVGNRKNTRQFITPNKHYLNSHINMSVNESTEYQIDGKPYQLEAAFINTDFLIARGTESKYPQLFDDDDTQITVFMRVTGSNGPSPYITYSDTYQNYIDAFNLNRYHAEDIILEKSINGFLSIKNFDWNSKVEFVILVTCTKITTEEYDKIALDWRKLPFSAQMVDGQSFFGKKGPIFRPTLNYVGHLSIDNLDKDAALKDENISEFLKQFEKDVTVSKSEYNIYKNYKGSKANLQNQSAVDPKNFNLNGIPKDKNILDIIEKVEIRDTRFDRLISQIQKMRNLSTISEFKESGLHLFATYIKPSYESLRGKMIESIRPFGEVKGTTKGILGIGAGNPDYYHMKFQNLRTPDGTGLAKKSASSFSETQMGGSYEPVFSFQAPGDFYNSKAPWMLEGTKTIRNVTGTPVTKAEIEEWMEKYPQVVNEPYNINKAIR